MSSLTDTRLQPEGTAQQRRSVAKYRPSLTAIQIEKILWLAKTELPLLSKESMSLISTLAPFQAKIENAGIQVAYTTSDKPRANSLESLGAGNPPVVEDKEAYWERCFNNYQSNPASCTLAEILAVAEHRYLNDMMSPEEEAAHEESNNE